MSTVVASTGDHHSLGAPTLGHSSSDFPGDPRAVDNSSGDPETRQMTDEKGARYGPRRPRG